MSFDIVIILLAIVVDKNLEGLSETIRITSRDKQPNGKKPC